MTLDQMIAALTRIRESDDGAGAWRVQVNDGDWGDGFPWDVNDVEGIRADWSVVIS